MVAERGKSGLDPALAARLREMSVGGQRWLKTALLTITSNDQLLVAEPAVAKPRRQRQEPPLEFRKEPPPAPATLEDVVSGKANLRDHLEAFPELAEELDGLAEIIDLLRESGERKRKKGEEILREEILGEDEPVPGEEEFP